MLDSLLLSFENIFSSPIIFLIVLCGVTIGLIFGAIPGLSATMAIIMFLPVTYSMPCLHSISFLVALYIGGISGGLVSAILLNIPGTPSSIATCFDGWPMTQKGQASKALGVGIVFSFIGTIVGLLFLTILSPVLANLAVKLGAYEYCAITIFSISVIITVTGKDMLKGLISIIIGAMFATVGLSPIDSVKRFTFDNYSLLAGFKLIVVLIGLFAVTEALRFAEAKENQKVTIADGPRIKGFGFSLKEFVRQLPNAIRSALIGVLVGILPGIGGSVSSMLSYTVSKQVSKHPEDYGTGIIDGVVASETANNATIGGAMIPLLSLGIPGDGTTAVLLGGLIISGVAPGPLIFERSGETVYGIFIMMAVAAIFALVVEFFGLRLFVKLLNIPKGILYPIILVFCCVGAIGSANLVSDCWGIVLFGLIGFLLSKADFPIVPVVIGFILGPILELNVRRVSMLAQTDSLLSHPVAIVFLVISLFVLIRSVIKNMQQGRK